MTTLILLATVITCFTAPLEDTYASSAIGVEFSGAGTLEPDLGETLFLNCSATSFHVIELLEIGQYYSIDEKLSFNHPAQPGNPVTRYEPEGCSLMEEEKQCSKVVTITVTEEMDGKAYQCLAFRRGYEHIITYSKGGYVRVRDASTSPPTSTSPPATAIAMTAAPLAESDVQDSPSVHTLTDGNSECNGSVTMYNPLSLWTVMVSLIIVRHLLL